MPNSYLNFAAEELLRELHRTYGSVRFRCRKLRDENDEYDGPYYELTVAPSDEIRKKKAVYGTTTMQADEIQALCSSQLHWTYYD